MEKIFVRVECLHMEDGTVIPKTLFWNDGRYWEIKRVIHSCRSSNHEFEGIRYLVLIGSAEKIYTNWIIDGTSNPVRGGVEPNEMLIFLSGA